MEPRTPLGDRPKSSKVPFQGNQRGIGQGPSAGRDSVSLSDFIGKDCDSLEFSMNEETSDRRISSGLAQRFMLQNRHKPPKPMESKRRKGKSKKAQHLEVAKARQGDEQSTKCSLKVPAPAVKNGFRDPCLASNLPHQVGTKKQIQASPRSSPFVDHQEKKQETVEIRNYFKKPRPQLLVENLCDSNSDTEEESSTKPKQPALDLDCPIPRKKSRPSSATARASPSGSTSTISSTCATSLIKSFEPVSPQRDPLRLSRSKPFRSNRAAFGKSGAGVNKTKKFRAKKIPPPSEFGSLDNTKEKDKCVGLTKMYDIHHDLPKRDDYSSRGPTPHSSPYVSKKPRYQNSATPPAIKKRRTSDDVLVDSSPERPLRRSKRKTSKKSIEVIEIDDESDFDETSDQDDVCVALTRIAVGRNVFREDCTAKLSSSTAILKLSYKSTAPKTRSTRNHKLISLNIALNGEHLREIKYFKQNVLPAVNNTTSLGNPFISLRIIQAETNGLSMYNNAYDPGADAPLEKRFLVLEFPDEETFQRICVKLEKSLPQFVNEFSCLDAAEDAHEFCASLTMDNENKEKFRTVRKSKEKAKQGFLANKEDDSVLVVYPFDGDSKRIDEAGKDLPILSFNNDLEWCDSQYENESSQQIVIRARDYERLDPDIYLNDTIIDFFCQWIFRRNSGNDVHVFTSHFYSALEKKGPEAVAPWTQRRKIDIFQKKFIMIPVNKTAHWSLVVVVNPSSILSHDGIVETGKSLSDEDAKKPMPCIVFLDSLKFHRKDPISRNILKWLNAEWNRKETVDPTINAGTPSQPMKENVFTTENMKIVSPKVPYQSNGSDCGVFVCRYAYGFKCIQSCRFSYEDAGYAQPQKRGNLFRRLISNSEAFQFGDEEILSLRKDMKTLIERLHGVYDSWSSYQKRKRKLGKGSSNEVANDMTAPTGDTAPNSGDDDTSDSKLNEECVHHAALQLSKRDENLEMIEPEELGSPQIIDKESSPSELSFTPMSLLGRQEPLEKTG